MEAYRCYYNTITITFSIWCDIKLKISIVFFASLLSSVMIDATRQKKLNPLIDIDSPHIRIESKIDPEMQSAICSEHILFHRSLDFPPGNH